MLKWTPERYLDEIVPEPRSTPSDWIVGERNGRWRLANNDGDDEGDDTDWRIDAAEGDVVQFCAFEDFGTFDVEILPGGAWRCAKAIPNATHFCIGGDADTLADTMDAFVAGLDDMAGETVEVAVYTWHDAENFRLAVDDGAARFVAVTPVEGRA